MNRAMIKKLTHTEMITLQPKTVFVPYFTYHGELHLTDNNKIINR